MIHYVSTLHQRTPLLKACSDVESLGVYDYVYAIHPQVLPSLFVVSSGPATAQLSFVLQYFLHSGSVDPVAIVAPAAGNQLVTKGQSHEQRTLIIRRFVRLERQICASSTSIEQSNYSIIQWF